MELWIKQKKIIPDYFAFMSDTAVGRTMMPFILYTIESDGSNSIQMYLHFTFCWNQVMQKNNIEFKDMLLINRSVTCVLQTTIKKS